MLCDKFGWTWIGHVAMEETKIDIQMSIMLLGHFIVSPIEKGHGPLLE